jgi:hypothetical protein
MPLHRIVPSSLPYILYPTYLSLLFIGFVIFFYRLLAYEQNHYCFPALRLREPRAFLTRLLSLGNRMEIDLYFSFPRIGTIAKLVTNRPGIFTMTDIIGREYNYSNQLMTGNFLIDLRFPIKVSYRMRLYVTSRSD